MNRIRVLLIAILSLCATTVVMPQNPGSRAPRIRIGPGDLLEVKIFDAPEVTQSVRVDDVGDATLLLIGAIHLSGLTTEQGQELIADKYKAGNFFLHPDVSVLIQEYSTQGAAVLGEVSKPGVYPVLGSRSLLEIISAAGGITPTASNEVTIQRHLDGSVLTAHLSRDARSTIAADVEIQPGDKVVVQRAGIVYVIGNVTRPGGFVMQNDGKISILQAVAMAGGSNGTASLNHAKLIRKTSTGYVDIPVALKKILKGEETDQPMEAEDILFIPNSSGRSILYRGVPGIVQSASSAAIYATY